jgi:hypothetical protein
MKTNLLKLISVILWSILPYFLTSTTFAGNGATLDGYSIRVTKGQKPAEPSILTKDEEGTFNFDVTLSHNNTRIEEVPPNMSLIYLITSSDKSVITNVLPRTYSAPDNKTFNRKSKVIFTNGSVDNAVRAGVKFTLRGKQKVTLRVSLMRNSDRRAVADSESIEINVIRATCTVYAKKPNVKFDFMRHPYCSSDDVGHSFWKISMDSDSITSDDENFRQQILLLNNNKWGHYPKGNIVVLTNQSGQIVDDNGHEFTHSKTFDIKADDALAALRKIKELHSNANLKYHLIDKLARNCTGQCVL